MRNMKQAKKKKGLWTLLRENLPLFLITLVSMAGLIALSHLTILDFLYDMEEQYDHAANEEIIRELETSIEYGKSLDNYHGLHSLLARAKSLLREENVLVIFDQDGQALATSSDAAELSIDPKQYGEISQPIRENPSGEDALAGSFVTYYSRPAIQAEASDQLRWAAIGSAALFVLLVLCVLLAAWKLKWGPGRLTTIVVVAVLLQSIGLTILYVPSFQAAAQRNVRGVALYLESTLDDLADRGISTSDISDLDAVLEQRQQAYPWIQEIELQQAGQATESANRIILPLRGADSDLVISFEISSSYLRGNVIQMLLTFAATIFLAVVVMKESLAVSELASFRQSRKFGTRCAEQFDAIARTLRYMSFLSGTTVYICLSFSALQIKAWNQGFLGMSPGTAAALSISLCALAEAGGMVFMPILGARLRPRQLLSITSALLIFSNFACFLTTSVPVMLLMRFLSGLSTAGHKQVVNSIIAAGYETEAQRAANLSGNNYGIIGGILCGMGLGSIIAGAFGYAATFFAAGVGSVLYLLFAWHFLPWRLFTETDQEGGVGQKVRGMLRAFTDPALLHALVRIALPHYFLLMVIVVLVPGRVQSAGMPDLVLTYANLLNGIFGLYIGTYVGAFLQKRMGQVRTLGIMFLSGAAAMALFDLPVFPIATLILGAVIAGLIDGVASPLATELFIGNRAIAGHMDEASGLMLYAILGNVIMTAAPLVLERCEQSPVWMYGAAIVLALISLNLLTIRKSAKGA